VSYNEFSNLCYDLDRELKQLDNILKGVDKFARSQTEFNKCVAEILHLDKQKNQESFERGVYQ